MKLPSSVLPLMLKQHNMFVLFRIGPSGLFPIRTVFWNCVS